MNENRTNQLALTCRLLTPVRELGQTPQGVPFARGRIILPESSTPVDYATYGNAAACLAGIGTDQDITITGALHTSRDGRMYVKILTVALPVEVGAK